MLIDSRVPLAYSRSMIDGSLPNLEKLSTN